MCTAGLFMQRGTDTAICRVSSTKPIHYSADDYIVIHHLAKKHTDYLQKVFSIVKPPHGAGNTQHGMTDQEN